MYCPAEEAHNLAVEQREAFDALVDTAIAAISPVRGGAALINRDHPRSTIEATIERFLRGDSQALALIGTLDDMPVGFLVASVQPTDTFEQVASIEALWVDVDARQLGVGEVLLTTCLQWATAQNCVALDADALPGDRDTKNFFESHGLVARGIRVSRSL